ncbi:hypothetical protein E4T39_01276 [Aureobasidium subglaciale]|nr:hypothetical protein E4T39_01276 [Aureobasidium subglaciale]
MFTARAAKQLRSPILRQLGRRQLHGAGETGFQGAADNAFNRERAAVKDHAAATSGTLQTGFFFVAYQLALNSANFAHDRPLAQALHLNSQNSIVVPSIVLASVNAYSLWLEHWEHKAHEPPKSEQPEYSFQNIRTKNYFWGDGDKTIFWNDKVNYHKKSDE